MSNSIFIIYPTICHIHQAVFHGPHQKLKTAQKLHYRPQVFLVGKLNGFFVRERSDGAPGDSPELFRVQPPARRRKLPAHVVITTPALGDSPRVPRNMFSYR